MTRMLSTLAAGGLGAGVFGLGVTAAQTPPELDTASTHAHITWWADAPVQPTPAPTVTNNPWCTNPIDHFILAHLEAADIEPAPQADRATLIRRATYDLTGLPPTPEAVEAFVNNDHPDAWANLIDDLLASDQYGAKWARHWLDLARYAETDGYERDRIKPGAWRYRDWVIDAYNNDMPYDEFVIHQLAGDEIPHANFESLVATGFLHLGVRDDEPTDPPLAIQDDLDGMLDVTCRATLAISMGCARCHDHKKDPLPTRDYYRMQACFADLKPYRTGFGNTVRQDNFVRQLPMNFGHEDDGAIKSWVTARTNLTRSAEALAVQAGISEPNLPPVALAGEVTHINFEGDPEICEPGLHGHALLVNTNDAAMEIARPVAEDFSLTIAFRPDADGPGDNINPRWFLGAGLIDGEIPGVVNDFGLSWVKGRRIAAGVGNPETFLHSPGQITLGQWHVATLTREQATGTVQLWLDGEHVATATGGTQSLDAPDTLHVGIMHTGHNHFPGAIDEVRIHDRVLRPQEILALHDSTAFGESAGNTIAGTLGMAGALAHGHLVSQRLGLERPVVETVPVLAAIPSDAGAADTFILERGNPQAKGDMVHPGVPTMLGGQTLHAEPPAHGKSTGRRLALARWITSPDNPRTARVLANRIWQHHFGRGIAPTPDDFGNLGLPPTHPHLLDWLAARAVETGWSRKALHRLIMQSSTYQMAANVPLNQRDPINALWHRFDPRRLTAEEVRDSMLAVSGTLNPTLGGPWTYPPLPRDVLETASRPDAAWGHSSPADAAKRSIHVHVKRSLRHPLLHAFDQADTDTACPVRFATVPPTQALIMLNSDETNTFAAALQTRLKAHSDNLHEQCRRGLELVTQSPASDADIAELIELHDTLHKTHGLSQDDALKYVCLTMLNMNAFVHIN